MKLRGMTFVVVTIFLCCLTTYVTPLGENCSQTRACTDSNVVCTSGVCVCATDYYNDGEGKTCLPKNILGFSCQPNVPATVPCKDPMAVCTGANNRTTCRCKDGYFDDNGETLNGTCVTKLALLSTCPDPVTSGVTPTEPCAVLNAECGNDGNGVKCHCTEMFYDKNGQCVTRIELGSSCATPAACVTENADCINAKCSCKPGYYDNKGTTSSCSSKVSLGMPCPQPDACGTMLAVCSDRNGIITDGITGGGKCVCGPGYFKNTSGDGCIPKVYLGVTCTTSDACQQLHSGCNNGICECGDGYFDSNGHLTAGGMCEPYIELGYSCNQQGSCRYNNTVCSEGMCTCDTYYYDNNGRTRNGGTCEKRHILNTQCDWTAQTQQTDQCIDAKAKCTFNGADVYVCTCISGYHSEGMVCIADKPLGNTCTQDTDCSDRNAKCFGSLCICGDQYFDSNGFESGGNCKPISNLQVTGVAFSDVTTTSFNVHWTLPSASRYIDVMLVAWNATSNAGEYGSLSLDSFANTTLVSIATNITAGRAYTVSVITRNTRTHSINYRQTMATSMQAAKPLPLLGPLHNIDLDASDEQKGISFEWHYINYLSGFEVTLTDGSEELQRINTSQSRCTLNPSLLYGHRYNITIVSRSELFTSAGNHITFVTSEPYTEEVKTVVERPGAPVNPRCKSDDPYTISLTWSPPAASNGDLVQYHVTMFESSQGSPLINETVEAPLTYRVVRNLIPGHSYMFMITTENEDYISEPVNINQCTTPTAKSAEPQSFTISVVTSRSMTMFWEYPERVNSEEIFGYILQIRDAAEACVYEQLFKCSDCVGSFQEPSLEGVLCPEIVGQPDKMMSKFDLSRRITITVTAGLLPDVDYIVSVSAVNGQGQGKISTLHQRTDEEAPQLLTNVGVTDIQTTSMIVFWTLDGPRPGRVNYTIHLAADEPADSPLVTIQGFEMNNMVMWDLQEKWGYIVSVTANTSRGKKTEILRRKSFTKPSAPGPVDAFRVETPGDDYTKVQVSWKIPTILERNSIITGYTFKYNGTGWEIIKMISTEAESYIYSEIVVVSPGLVYAFEVFAVNDHNQNGTLTTRIVQAPAAAQSEIPSGAVIGGALGAVAVGIIITVLVVIVYKKHKSRCCSSSPDHVYRQFMKIKYDGAVDGGNAS